MPEYELTYFLLASGFVVYIDIIVVAAIGFIHRSEPKRYLFLAACAGIVETLRQVPDLFVSLDPAATTYYPASILLQFTSTLIFVAALLHLIKTGARKRRVLLLVPIIGFAISMFTLLNQGIPVHPAFWYLFSAPLFLATLTLVWAAAQISTGWTPGRFLMVGLSLMLLVLRFAVTGMELGDTFYLLYYVECLLFPMLIAALILTESELTQRRVSDLLAERTQSGEDLQFIVDNSDDIVLVANEVGLVQSWSARAAAKFGYSSEQALNKLHMDDLFAQITLKTPLIGTREFQTKMEASDGSWFKVDVRSKTVAHRGAFYSIFVLKEVPNPGQETQTPAADTSV